MLEAPLRAMALNAKAKTGASGELAIWLLVVALCSVASLGFLTLAAFFWLTQLYGAVVASVVLGFTFMATTGAIIVRCTVVRRRNRELALAKMAAESPAWWVDPRIMAVGLEVGRMIGWRRIVPLVVVGLVVASLNTGSARTTLRKG